MAQPLLLIAVFAIGAFAGMTAEQLYWRLRRRAWRPRKRSIPYSADQLRTVMGANFTVQPILNKGEARVFKELDRAVIARNPAWQVMAQVSLGEVLRCKDAEAYSCINSKRVDLLLMDEECRPRHAIRVSGRCSSSRPAAATRRGQEGGSTRAGVGYHEVVAGHTTPSELTRLVEKLVDTPQAQ